MSRNKEAVLLDILTKVYTIENQLIEEINQISEQSGDLIDAAAEKASTTSVEGVTLEEIYAAIQDLEATVRCCALNKAINVLADISRYQNIIKEDPSS